jgi:hypothetical protein
LAHDAYVLLDHRVLVYWSRKAANTALTDWLFESVVTVRRDRKARISPRKFMVAGQYKIEYPMALEFKDLMGFDDFIIARDPFRRAVSIYLEKFVYYRDTGLDSVDKLTSFAQRAYQVMKSRHAGKAGDKGDYPGVSFVEFLEYVSEQVESRVTGHEPDLNGHFLPQVPFAFVDRGIEYSKVIHLENIQSEIWPLANRIGSTLPFPMVRSSAVKANLAPDVDLSETRSVDLIRSGLVPAASNLLSPRTQALVLRAYGHDLTKLGYATAETSQAA